MSLAPKPPTPIFISSKCLDVRSANIFHRRLGQVRLSNQSSLGAHSSAAFRNRILQNQTDWNRYWIGGVLLRQDAGERIAAITDFVVLFFMVVARSY
jgi:hypothetical protein